jgi:hypothetical protein
LPESIQYPTRTGGSVQQIASWRARTVRLQNLCRRCPRSLLNVIQRASSFRCWVGLRRIVHVRSHPAGPLSERDGSAHAPQGSSMTARLEPPRTVISRRVRGPERFAVIGSRAHVGHGSPDRNHAVDELDGSSSWGSQRGAVGGCQGRVRLPCLGAGGPAMQAGPTRLGESAERAHWMGPGSFVVGQGIA